MKILVILCAFLLQTESFAEGRFYREHMRSAFILSKSHLMNGRKAYSKGEFEIALKEYEMSFNTLPLNMKFSHIEMIAEHIADAVLVLDKRLTNAGKKKKARELVKRYCDLHPLVSKEIDTVFRSENP